VKFRRIRFRLWVKIVFPLLFLFIIFFSLGRKTRGRLFPYFDTRCIDYRQKDYSRRLNDRILDYGAEAKRRGIVPCANDGDLNDRISHGELVRVRTGNLYIIEKMTYSIPYVTRDTRKLLDEIAQRLRDKASAKGLKGTRFIVTSMTRKTENVKMLRRLNGNSSENSPHLYGNAFDISYKRITARKLVLTNCDKKFLKDALAEVIWELKQEKRCWATYERMQSCYHVVAR
jgi:hypothetical protein